LSLRVFILAVSDIWDAMTQDRYYRLGMSVEKAMQVFEDMTLQEFSDRASVARADA
jgi:HD-GYP domain-containing protein (c-di-GMP phosphodiesterase class II)